MVKGPVNECPTSRGGFRERLVYVFRTFSKKSCNSTVLQRSDHQKHVVKLTLFFREYVKTRRKIDIIFANVSKHVVKVTLLLPICQNTL